MPCRLIAGVMSGTSADGIDVALTSIDGIGFAMKARLVHHHAVDYPRALRQTVLSIRHGDRISLRELTACGREISLLYARAVQGALEAARMTPANLTAIAAHGQTLFHDPPDTLQWLDPALVASRTGCPVVSDFRRADCAAGGQGAPLVPFADCILFRDPQIDRVVLNLGGIANLTRLPAGSGGEGVVAFDIGPGNCISDWLMRTRDPAGPGVDLDGGRAAAGEVIRPVVERFRADPFFARPGPKSTDGPTMVAIYQAAVAQLRATPSLDDELATACAITTELILDELRPGEEPLVSGGGTRNAEMMRRLRAAFPNLRTTDATGVPSQAREAMAFAILGAATLDGVPSNLPACTGAARPVVLGSITPRP